MFTLPLLVLASGIMHEPVSELHEISLSLNVPMNTYTVSINEVRVTKDKREVYVWVDAGISIRDKTAIVAETTIKDRLFVRLPVKKGTIITYYVSSSSPGLAKLNAKNAEGKSMMFLNTESTRQWADLRKSFMLAEPWFSRYPPDRRPVPKGKDDSQ
jgi:hypothetical protein